MYYKLTILLLLACYKKNQKHIKKNSSPRLITVQIIVDKKHHMFTDFERLKFFGTVGGCYT